MANGIYHFKNPIDAKADMSGFVILARVWNKYQSIKARNIDAAGGP